MQGQYSLRSPAVKRLMKEAQELNEATEQYYAQPLEDNLFEWHFTIRGPQDSEFEHGIYHGRIILPPEYPMKPPNIVMLTPNGRFDTFKKICLSISGYHPESWQPSWSIRTALLAIIGFMPTHGNGAIGSLDYTPEERKKLAKRSQDHRCEVCGSIKGVLLEPTETEKSKETQAEAKQLASQMSFHGEKEKKALLSAASEDSNAQQNVQPTEPSQNDQPTSSTDQQNTDSHQAANSVTSSANAPDSVGTPNGESSVRQRNAPRNNSTSSNASDTTVVARQQHAAGSTGSLALIVLLASALALLLFRRLYISGNLIFPEL